MEPRRRVGAQLCAYPQACNDDACGCSPKTSRSSSAPSELTGTWSALPMANQIPEGVTAPRYPGGQLCGLLPADYTSECSKCDGSECGGDCDVANLGDVQDEADEGTQVGRVGYAGPTVQASAGAPTMSRRGGSGFLSFNEPNQIPQPRNPLPRGVNFPLNRALLVYEEEGRGDDIAMPVQPAWNDIDIEVVLDSGCSDHVMNVELDAPGNQVRPSAASREGRSFVVGNGERVANEGGSVVNLTATDEHGMPVNFSSTFQSAGLTKALMSVAKICSNGHKCQFDGDQALVKDNRGKTVCRFVREKGIYVARMKLRAPSPFGRHE